MTSPSRKNRASSNPLDPQGIGGETVALEILALWEQGQITEPAFRGIALLSVATGESLGNAGNRPLGSRDRQLLELRRRLIGEEIEARATCPNCTAEIETRFNLGDVLQQENRGVESIDIAVDGLNLVIRAPSATAIAQLAQPTETQQPLRDVLVGLCVESCTDASGRTADVPTNADVIIAKAVETLDPLAAITVSLSCPECRAELDMPFDPAEFVWHEIETAAERLLWEVDQLARIYHWREAEILSLSPARRQIYLGMALA